jgi:multisubunit Na+/H+ antiporter MnhC subunit
MSRVPKPNPYLVAFRILLVAILFTLLSFAISLLLGILGIVGWSALHHVSPNLPLAYRHFALPVAIVVGITALVIATAVETRHYRQAKALAAIERMSS